jgi:hypothetical protein
MGLTSIEGVGINEFRAPWQYSAKAGLKSVQGSEVTLELGASGFGAGGGFREVR